MSFRNWQLRIQDILAAIAKIQRYTADMTFEDFAANEIITQAVFYNYLIIGEATQNIPIEIQALNPEIPWRAMADMRNVMAHEYFQINLGIVWETSQNDLSELTQQLQNLLQPQDHDF